ncbi:hypothetical protein O181_051509 [Austropuccinia psidii MF-1]|uniref:Uncharacterized protein n=1 Tax=Austropuccinia psidii MF-1 TaxID=1389203 RepID=A0A9Q3HQS5_9BASI|nr:hypothetical protein [Austropuccinia psidii MF-1]
MVVAIQPGAKLGPIGHVISFRANWPPWVFYGSYAITHSNGHLWPQAISCCHWPSWPISTAPTPRPSSLILGLGGSFCLQGASRLPSHLHPTWETPFHQGGSGLNGLFGPFRPAGRDSRSTGQLGPFWPNPMRPKGAKGGYHLAPKARWVPNHNWTHPTQN